MEGLLSMGPTPSSSEVVSLSIDTSPTYVYCTRLSSKDVNKKKHDGRLLFQTMKYER